MQCLRNVVENVTLDIFIENKFKELPKFNLHSEAIKLN